LISEKLKQFKTKLAGFVRTKNALFQISIKKGLCISRLYKALNSNIIWVRVANREFLPD
jgi:hypothetical protein